jgi:DNA primase
VLCLDGDPAGQQATARTIEQLRPLASSGELELAVVSLPEGGDPDTLIRSEGAAAFRQRLQQARHWLSWELERLLAPALA